MNLTLVKILVTPALIGLASLAGRKWGHAVSGWLVALPLTTGPIVFFLAVSHGPEFAAETAAGMLTGCFSLVAFTMVYAWVSQRWAWLPTLSAASLAFLVMTALLRNLRLPLFLVWIAVLSALLAALRSLPPLPPPPDSAPQLPSRWDLPMRMVIATCFVLLITGLAPAVGPHTAGLLAPFPLFTAILAAFAQHQSGAAAAISVLRGLLLGLFGYASFMFTLSLLLPPVGIVPAFALALLVLFAFQAIALRLLLARIR